MKLDELKSLLSRFNIKPSKKLGQNFLLNEEVLDEMMQAAELTSRDTVLEVGPGLGVLTRKLGERAGLVLAVEKDRKLATALHRIFRNKKNIKIIQGDVLSFAPEQYKLRANSYKLVANIPYYLTGKIIKDYLTSVNQPSMMVLLLQKEVAERIVAEAGNHTILSISTKLYADSEIITYVPKSDFYPVPKVDSAVLKISVNDDLKLDVDADKFMQLVKIGFSSPRKMLVNNLKNLPGDNEISQMFDRIQIDPKVRPQDLSLEQWAKIYHALGL